MPKENTLYGLVVCGGISKRMGRDKSELTYFKKPQRYHLYEMLENFCSKVFISCNTSQANKISKDYPTLTDLPCYENIGPMAALLTAFELNPYNDFLVVGCDYPLISENDLKEFSLSLKDNKKATAFYNVEESLYEPLLAWYPANSADLLRELFHKKQYSLQKFLNNVNAEKYYPGDKTLIKSMDTPEEFIYAGKVILEEKDKSKLWKIFR